MGFKRTEPTKDKPTIDFEPIGQHKWLSSVHISVEYPANPKIIVFVREDMDAAYAKRKIEELKGLKTLFEDHSRQSDKPLLAITGQECMEDYVAGPNSNIRQILQMMHIPADMQVAVMDALQQLWREKTR